MKLKTFENFTVIKPTDKEPESLGPSVFLAGSIEMGAAEDWQKKVAEHFDKEKWNVTFFNPRRDEWDSSWKQEEKSSQFNQQVNWELNHLNSSHIIFMYLDPETKSPISLLELGLYAASNKMIVCCPDGFYRKGNVEIVCSRFNIPLFNTLEDGLGALETKLRTIIRL